MGQTQPLFVDFVLFSIHNDKHSTKFDYIGKCVDGMPGIRSGTTGWFGATNPLNYVRRLRGLFLQNFFFKNWANPGLFFVYFRSFQTNNTIFYNKSM